MRNKIAAIIAVLLVLGGLAWEWPLRALSALGVLMTVLGVPTLYESFIDWITAHPHLVIDTAPWVMLSVGLLSLAYLFIWPHIWAHIQYKPLQILFDEEDQSGRFIKRQPGVIRFCVGLYNARRDGKTIQFANLRAHESDFAKEVLGPVHRRPAWEDDPMLEEPFLLDAGAVHYVELFGMGDAPPSVPDPYLGNYPLDIVAPIGR